MCVPDSCCKTSTSGCGRGAMTDSTKIYTTGCFTGFQVYIADNAGATARVVVGVIALLFWGICIACCVGRGLAKESHYYNENIDSVASQVHTSEKTNKQNKLEPFLL